MYVRTKAENNVRLGDLASSMPGLYVARIALPSLKMKLVSLTLPFATAFTGLEKIDTLL